MIEQDLASQIDEIFTLPKEVGESDIHYERRLIDPLEVVYANADERLRLSALDDEGVAKNIKRGHTQEAVEFEADFVYRSLGILPTRITQEHARQGRELITETLEVNKGLKPDARLRLEMRRIDFMSIEFFNSYTVAKANASGQEKPKIERAYDAARTRIIREGVDILQRYRDIHESLTDDEIKQNLRGSMFELLYMTYRRYKISEADEYDSPIVVGATEFEDQSASHFKPFNHNYDVLVIRPDGEVSEVIQCKNGSNKEEYERPIQKVNGRGFGQFIDSPGRFIEAVDELVSNSPHVTEEKLQRNKALLASLFETPVRSIGKQALVTS